MTWVRISGAALNWFNSYLTNRVFNVCINNRVSSPAPLLCGVPQGSVPGPVLFSRYVLRVVCSAASMTCHTAVMQMIHRSTLQNPIT